MDESGVGGHQASFFPGFDFNEEKPCTEQGFQVKADGF
jgi:hypothetical protein